MLAVLAFAYIGVVIIGVLAAAAWLIEEEFPLLLAGLGGLVVGLLWPLFLVAIAVALVAKKVARVLA